MEAETGKNEEFVDLISSERPVDNFLSRSIFSRNSCSYFSVRGQSASYLQVCFWRPLHTLWDSGTPAKDTVV